MIHETSHTIPQNVIEAVAALVLAIVSWWGGKHRERNRNRKRGL